MAQIKESTEVLFQALCDPENQPHQWIGHPDELEKAFFKSREQLSGITLDIKEITKSVILRVKIKGLDSWVWRLRLVGLIFQLIGKLCPVDLELVTDSEERPYLYYCPYCHRDVYGRQPEEAEYKTIACSHCHRQFLVVGDFNGPELVTEDTFDLCEYECHWQNPYGFVPEAGCPIHDRA